MAGPYTITVTAGDNGTVLPLGAVTVNAGDSQLFTAVPDEGYELTGWLLDGTLIAAEGNIYTITAVAAAHTLAAQFTEARSILAIVDRNPPGPLDGIPGMNANNIEITVKNHPTEGICLTVAAPTADNPFDAAIIAQADSFINCLGPETITYYPSSANGLDTNRDFVKIAVKQGGTPEKKRITKIISQDAGILRLEVH